jgi:hypothetical protein
MKFGMEVPLGTLTPDLYLVFQNFKIPYFMESQIRKIPKIKNFPFAYNSGCNAQIFINQTPSYSE